MSFEFVKKFLDQSAGMLLTIKEQSNENLYSVFFFQSIYSIVQKN